MLPERLLARYQPIRSLGEGAFGAVMAARDRELGREVAIKVLTRAGDQAARVRFAREAAVLAALGHPNLVRIFDHGEAPEGPWLVMELLEGTRLDRLDPARAVGAVLQLAEGLSAIHAAGLVHRDVKPSNAILASDGRAVLLDFGMVFDPARTALTATGLVVGTMGYMAPELLQGGDFGPASDFYALGATLATLLEGRPPYTVEQLMAVARGQPLPPLRLVRVAAGSREDRLVRTLMAADPAARPTSAGAVAGVAGEAPGSGEAVQARPEAAPPRAPSLPARPAARPPSPRAGLRLALAGGAGLLALALVARLAGPAPTQDPGQPPAVPGPDPGSEPSVPAGLPADLGALLEADLDHLLELDRDPLRYAADLAGLQGVAALHGWLARGGRAETLPGWLRTRMADFDRACLRDRRTRPFFPHLDGPGDAPPGPVDPLGPFFQASVETRDLPEPPARGPWLAACLTALGRALHMSEEQRRIFELGAAGGPAALPPAVASRLLGLVSSRFFETLEDLYYREESRREVARWLEPGSDEVERMLLAGMRSIRDEPATAEFAGLAVTAGVRRLRVYCLGPRTQLPVRVRTGGPPVSAAAGLVHAELLRVDTQAGRRLGYVSGAGFAEQAEAIAVATSPAVPEDPWGRRRLFLAVTRRVRMYLTAGEPAEAYAVWAGAQGLAARQIPAARLGLLQAGADAWLALDPAARPPRDALDRELAWARANLGEVGNDSARDDLQATFVRLAARDPARVGP